MKPLRILVAGVGGQGVLTAARAIGDAASGAGHEVVIGQIHGMSQRGGSVEASAVIGPGASQFIGAGQADVLVAFEPLELHRALPRASAGAIVLATPAPVRPFTLALSGQSYPDVDAILAEARAACRELVVLDSAALLREIGESRSLNVLMLGALAECAVLPFDGELLLSAFARRAHPRAIEANRRAFALGRRQHPARA